MANVLVGFILGFMVATSGFSGVVKMLDNGVDSVRTTVKNTENK
jgi:hypothetical protein